MAHFIAFKQTQTEKHSEEAFYWIKEITGLEKISVHELRKDLFLSLSHTKGLMGFVLSHQVLGLDLELKERIVPEKVQRYIAHEKDLLQGLEAWCLKEAAFKAFSYYEKNLMLKEIFIDDHVQTKSLKAQYQRIPHEEYVIYLVENVTENKFV